MHPLNNDIDTIVANGINNQPRSQQKLIGPSELGTKCTRCLARKLAGVEKLHSDEIEDVPWLPAIGTAVHAMLEEFFIADNKAREKAGNPIRWKIEEKLDIGKIGEHNIAGSCDLFDLETNTVIDHKIVGQTKLTEVAKKGPGDQYRIQAHLYGLGWSLLGYDVTEVAVKFYPRNHISLATGQFWSEKYDKEVALSALKRANDIYDTVVSTDNLKEYLLSLETDKSCFSCSEYPPLIEETPSYEDELFSQPNHKS